MSTLAAQHSSYHALAIKNDSRDESYHDIFGDFIKESPELNLINDLVSPDDDLDQKPLLHSAAFGHMQLPLLQRNIPPPLHLLNQALKQQPSTTTPPSSGGISPTLTWSGDPSPIDNANSPTLNDTADLDGEEWNPPSSSPTAQLFAAVPTATANTTTTTKSSSSRRNSAGSARGRDVSDALDRASSHSRSRSSKRSGSSSTSADGGDELTMSNLSIQNGTTSLSALMSGPPSPQATTASMHTPKPASHSAAPARKKTRTSSSSRSSISSIDALISEAMGPASAPSPTQSNSRLVPTGHRRNITSASLVPLDAPTQIRNYLTPSSTSKKEIPSAFVARRNKLKAKEAAISKPVTPGPSTAGRKRTREDAGVDEVDQLQDDEAPGHAHAAALVASPPSSPGAVAELASESSSLLSAIEAKRRQNTLAARRSRQRKLDYVRNLEELVSALTRERDSWKSRAEGAEKILGYRPDEDEMDEA